MPPLDDMFARHEHELAVYTDERVTKLLKMLEAARKDLQAVISDVEDLQPRRVASLVDQIDSISSDLRRGIRTIGPSSPDLAAMVTEHLKESVAAITGSNVVIALDSLNADVLLRFSLNELEHVTKLAATELETVKSVLFTKVGVRGENPVKVARQLVGRDSSFAGKFNHVETITRTETSTVYNAQSLDGLQGANQKYGLKLKKKIVETIDNKRNHPISQLLNGMVQTADKNFKVKVSEVNARASSLGKSGTGVFWPVVDGYYVGQRLPAHYRERGITVPTLEAVTVK